MNRHHPAQERLFVRSPGDLYCALWPLLGLAGLDEFTPQFNYWKRPEKLEDGGENILD